MKSLPPENSNEILLTELFTAEDRLKRETVDSILQRADELFLDLKQIVMDRHAWQAQGSEWWAPVHATYILGAIGGERAVTPLLAALRWSDAYDNEWVTEALPAIFGSVGEAARPALEKIVDDETAGIGARGLALDGLAAMSICHPNLETQIMPKIITLFRNRQEAFELRLAAASILLDFRYRDLRDELVAFIALEAAQVALQSDFVFLHAEDVDRELAQTYRAETYYKHDWLSFYDNVQISARLVRDERPRVLH